MVSFRDSLILAALFVAAPAATAFAESTAASDAPFLTVAQAADDEDEEDPAPAATTPTSTTPAATGTTSTAEPAPAQTGSAPTSTAEQQKLVSGAPLYNPNVAVHIVEQKKHSEAGRFEIAIYPAAVQVNGKFTQTIGSFGSLIYHLQENFALQVTGGYNWWNVEAGFNGELVNKFQVEAQGATSLLWTWAALGGVEVTPFNGKFTLFESVLAHFSFIVNGGLGAGGTRHQLKPQTVRASDNSVSPATYGDTGVKFMGSLGFGLRLRLGEHVAIRLEVRDVVYTARMEQVNGCNLTDLNAMEAKIIAGQDPANASVSGNCKVDEFTGTDPDTNYKRSTNVNLAQNLVAQQSSDVLNNVGLYLGVSFLF